MENSMRSLLRKKQMMQGGHRLLVSGDTPGQAEGGSCRIDRGSRAVANSIKGQSLQEAHQ